MFRARNMNTFEGSHMSAPDRLCPHCKTSCWSFCSSQVKYGWGSIAYWIQQCGPASVTTSGTSLLLLLFLFKTLFNSHFLMSKPCQSQSGVCVPITERESGGWVGDMFCWHSAVARSFLLRNLSISGFILLTFSVWSIFCFFDISISLLRMGKSGNCIKWVVVDTFLIRTKPFRHQNWVDVHEHTLKTCMLCLLLELRHQLFSWFLFKLLLLSCLSS